MTSPTGKRNHTNMKGRTEMVAEMPNPAKTQQEKKYDIEQSINIARLTLGECKFVLGKDDTQQAKFLIGRTLTELRDILTKLEDL